MLATTDPLPSLRHAQRADVIGAVLRNLTSVVIWLLAAILVLQVLGVRLGPLLAGAGVVGLAIGVGEATGEVERVGLRTTRLRGVDGKVWHVRNGEIERVGNKSRDWARVLLDVEVARGDEVARELRARVEEAIEGAEIPLPAPTEALVIAPER